MAIVNNVRILVKRGAGDPSTSLYQGELGFDTTNSILYVGNGIGNEASEIGPVQSLDDIGDVSVGDKYVNQVLLWDGAKWIAGDVSTAGTGATYSYVDASLAARDVSISILFIKDVYIDSSLNEIWAEILSIDSSLSEIKATYIPDSSLNPSYFVWNAGYLDVSAGGGDVTQAYVDGSLSTRDASISTNIAEIAQLDASIVRIEATYIPEASLGTGFSWDGSMLDIVPLYDTALDPSLEMPTSVGGIALGTTVSDLSGYSIVALWDDLLFPTTNPTLTAPSGTFAMSPITTLYEVSTNVALTFTSTLNRGSISPQYTADSPYRSGVPNNFNFTGTGLIDASSSSIPYITPATDVSIVIGTQNWSVNIGYDGGVQPYNNKGAAYDSSLAAGSLSATPTRSIEGVYPLFATTVDINTLTKQTLISMSTGTTGSYTLVAETGGSKQKFQIADKWLGSPTNNPLTGVQTYNTVSTSWEYQGGSAATSLTYWTTSSTTQTIQGFVEDYTQYTYNSDDRSSVQIRLIF